MKDYRIVNKELTEKDLNSYARQGYELHTYLVNIGTNPNGWNFTEYKVILVKNVSNNN